MDELICDDCAGPNPVWFTGNALWNQVVGSPYGILCPPCFIKRAETAGIYAGAWFLGRGA